MLFFGQLKNNLIKPYSYDKKTLVSVPFAYTLYKHGTRKHTTHFAANAHRQGIF
jgi:hypothetical protein